MAILVPRKTQPRVQAIQGHMHKEGHWVKNWKQRMFFLKVRSASLEYYDDSTNGPWLLKGTIELNNAAVVSDDASPFLNALKLVSGTGKVFYLRCESPEDKTRWLAVLAKVITGCRDPEKVFAVWSAVPPPLELRASQRD